MARLSSTASLRQRLSEQDLGAINRSLSEALDATAVQLASYLKTGFDRRDHVDYFRLDPRRQPYTGEFFKLATKHGFIDPDVPVQIAWATSLGSVINVKSKIIDPGNVRGDFEAGCLIVADDEAYSEMLSARTLYLAVAYTAGFTVQPEHVYDGTPAWLMELSELWASKLYYQKLSNAKGNDDKGGSRYTIPSVVSLRKMAERHVRFFPAAFGPLP